MTSGLTAPAGAYPQLASSRDARPQREAAAERSVCNIPTLVKALSARAFTQRRRATERLMHYGPEIYPYLVRAYRITRSPEVRLRIKQVAAHVYRRQRAGVEEGFLGIQPQPITHDDDDRLRPGETGIVVVRVLADTAAERIGLQPDDVIVRFDGRPIPADPHGHAFTQRVRALGPDTRVALIVLRGKERLRLRARLSSRPVDGSATADAEAVDRACTQWFHDRFERVVKTARNTETVRADGR